MDKHFSDLLEIFFWPSANRDRPATNQDRHAGHNLDLQQGGLDLWQSGLDLQQVGETFPGGRKNVRPLSCMKRSKLDRFNFDISLPQ